MTLKEELLLTAEHDYCMWGFNENLKKLNESQPKTMNSPIINMIDNATGFNKVDYKLVVMQIWWCEEIIKRRLKLGISIETISMMMDKLKEFFLKYQGEEMYLKVMQEIENDLED